MLIEFQRKRETLESAKETESPDRYDGSLFYGWQVSCILRLNLFLKHVGKSDVNTMNDNRL